MSEDNIGEWMGAVDSDLPGFYLLPLHERRKLLSTRVRLDDSELRALDVEGGLRPDRADSIIENAIGVLGVPLGVCAYLRVDGRDRIVPMAIEEPSVIAAASHGAKLLRAGGGVSSEVAPPLMEGQIQLLDTPDPAAAEAAIRSARVQLLGHANREHPRLVAAGGGALEIEVHHLSPCDRDDPLPPMLIVHLLVDVGDAMGANIVNSMCETLASELESLSRGRVRLRILTNLCDRRTVKVHGAVPFSALDLKSEGRGAGVASGIMEASVFAERDPHRATTHNKGIMNGVDAVLLALGQDWRAVESGAHAYAARSGRYAPLARWRVRGAFLEGELKMPMAIGVVGGILGIHPTVVTALRIADVTSAGDLAALVAAVGLAQNLGALRALAAEGIQDGHMRLHARKRSIALLPHRELSSARVAGVNGNVLPIDRDQSFVRSILPKVSRTFAISIEALPEGLRESVSAAYLLCRIVDTIEDEKGLGADRRKALFDAFDAELCGSLKQAHGRLFSELASLTDDGADGELCRGASAVFRAFRALAPAARETIRRGVLEMSRGMRSYSARRDTDGGFGLYDLEDLERYCYFVAGTVGEILTDLFEEKVPELTLEVRREIRARAVNFGLGLQLVNILKDVAADHARRVCFLPRSLGELHGVPLEHILDPSRRDSALRIIRDLAQRAREHLERAAEYTAGWPVFASDTAEGTGRGVPIRLFCLVPLALALKTLEEIERGDDVLLSGRGPKVPREAVAAILDRARDAAASDEALRRMLAELLRRS